ncbi:mitochondrial fission 1 protein isoform X1 [Folsomia candida]|uniref:Mitochondrial fission 1 protein n=1 Tax=Folsomia candida TaxID=158441 RepID=A0A481SY02_FOLCA|nr:mitochondrial fission 1 protein isoform X1 [Folsomia candida]XP_021965418.1 mitochondrial fission 1 protein isoform X2 [Folsomia candida]XP_021965419.1 mitochondrial fission 1 protein isoform X1 [Folsomia candida]XP_021965420.1 mitochondrial fission 1 protein isoform X1 [Folsomia candida]QBH73489.1 hypothetical protein [Folsomia candida]
MEVLTDFVTDDYLREFEVKYNDEIANSNGKPNDETVFQYAWCLTRSRLLSDVKKGVMFLEQLLASCKTDQAHKRDYLYYLAVGYTRMKDFTVARKYIKSLLQLEPGNRQAQELEKAIKSEMETEALKGAAMAGGGLLAAGALVALGMALLKKK